ncbi:Uncharacterized protein PFLU_1558 [Pseudomonas [fluorescens] SBW25]|uniref:Uncharacterized protein n=1 Tax=Pseudomonas fluorescens (strain SBW25) TaxID=216595 RepID=C3K618_PSEFS|nr:Uncharacterized protein PFLU_1558 [Pseudomonas fluorescens SBW25]
MNLFRAASQPSAGQARSPQQRSSQPQAHSPQQPRWPKLARSSQTSVKNAWPVFFLRLAFCKATCHLHTHAQHGFCHFHVLALQEHFGVLGKIQNNQRTFVLSPAQLDSAVGQLNNFQKGRRHKSLFSTKGRDYISHPPGFVEVLKRFLYGLMNGAI